MTRKERALLIRHEVTKYLARKGFSCHYEVGLVKRGRLRADVYAFNYKGDSIIVEVKSCWDDFKTDLKFNEYRPFCAKLYFAVDQDFPISQDFISMLKQRKIGLLVCQIDPKRSHLLKAQVSAQVNARSTALDSEYLYKIWKRLAFRSGKTKTNRNSWRNL